MKNNGNNLKTGDYYIGLDIGTNSVGWAVTDEEYNVQRFKGNSMWGVRLFEEASGAAERRSSRAARRRLARRKQRMLILELLFSEEIAKVDPNFFVRLRESFLKTDDRSTDARYSLFNDKNYTDKDYLKQFPTIYHLRSELIHSKEKHDIRLVYLALHHIMKKRGHFLYEADGNVTEKSLVEYIDELNYFLSSEYGYELDFEDKEKYALVLEKNDINVTQKKKLLREKLGAQQEQQEYNPLVLSDLLAGATVKFSDLFCDDELKNTEVKSISLKNDIDAVFESLTAAIGERIELILNCKIVFDAARLSQILGGNTYISDAKIQLYNKNKNDLAKLKEYIKTNYPQKYKEVFTTKKDKLNNYVAYSKNKLRSGDYCCSQESFCKYLISQFPEMKNTQGYENMCFEIENSTFLSPLTGTSNSVIPHQLNLSELEKILENASSYLSFLNTKDEDGLSVADKIISTFKFRIPYYVGPLSEKSPNHWIVRSKEKIYPWNFHKTVDTKRSAENFIINLIGRCTYTGEYVLPKDSLLYSEYRLRNEINLLRINGKELPRTVMDELYETLFVSSNKKVTKKTIKDFLLIKGYIINTDELSGIDDTIKTKLKSYHDLKNILLKTSNPELVEEIIQRILVFGDDKRMLRQWLVENCRMLDKKDIDYVCRLKYKDWGRFSKRFLTEIYHTDKSGKAFSIMDMLRTNNMNLMQLLSSDYKFLEEAEKVRKENSSQDYSLQKRIDEMYLSPAVRRSVRQAIKIVDEIVDIKKCAPKKIFIEVARGSREEMKNKRTTSRKNKLIELYQACKEDSNPLFEQLCNEEENRLRSDKLYLYYTQLGKCMYSGEIIDFSSLATENSKYDIDHIFPRSRVKDDSLDNRVLVKAELNREKTNTYPVDNIIRERMHSFWKMLKEKGFISDKKFTKLQRQTPLTDKELSEFVARQIVETQQSTKAVASLMKDMYKDTRIVYSKAGNVSDFRHKYEFIKCRDINNLHHAKDAYLNIVVGNVYDTKFTDNFFKNISGENYSLNKVFEFDTPSAWDAGGSSIKTVKHYMGKNNILVTRMAREGRGKLYDLTVLPAGKGQHSINENLEIEKYGGYNNVYGAYFIVVEHTSKKKRIRTIESVLLCDKPLYEKNPTEYCVKKLGLEDPEIIVPIIRMDSLLEINGSRRVITGRSNVQLIYKHTYELAIDTIHEQYIKNISKYVDRCSGLKKELDITEFDKVSAEENMELYSWFIKKLGANVYRPLFSNVLNYLNKCGNVFESLNMLEQCKVLLEILKTFKCDRQVSNLSSLCGKSSVGTILTSKNLSNMDSAYLINQSPTGLYEVKVNLLK